MGVKPRYTREQQDVIQEAVECGFDVSPYITEAFTPDQIREIFWGLMTGVDVTFITILSIQTARCGKYGKGLQER